MRVTKYEIHEGGIRVPLVFNWPAKFAAGERQALAHFTDIFPTFVEIAGLKPLPATKPLDGVSLVPVLSGRSDRPDPVRFGQWSRAVPNYTHNAAMRDGPWKLVGPDVSRIELTADSVLYNLSTDPSETLDVAAQYPERHERRKSALTAWSADVERERTKRRGGERKFRKVSLASLSGSPVV